MEKTHFIRDLLFQQVYELMSRSALNNGAAQGSNFWNLYSSGVRRPACGLGFLPFLHLPGLGFLPFLHRLGCRVPASCRSCTG